MFLCFKAWDLSWNLPGFENSISNDHSVEAAKERKESAAQISQKQGDAYQNFADSSTNVKKASLRITRFSWMILKSFSNESAGVAGNR